MKKIESISAIIGQLMAVIVLALSAVSLFLIFRV